MLTHWLKKCAFNSIISALSLLLPLPLSSTSSFLFSAVWLCVLIELLIVLCSNICIVLVWRWFTLWSCSCSCSCSWNWEMPVLTCGKFEWWSKKEWLIVSLGEVSLCLCFGTKFEMDICVACRNYYYIWNMFLLCKC